jgi:hypothetical protein
MDTAIARPGLASAGDDDSERPAFTLVPQLSDDLSSSAGVPDKPNPGQPAGGAGSEAEPKQSPAAAEESPGEQPDAVEEDAEKTAEQDDQVADKAVGSAVAGSAPDEEPEPDAPSADSEVIVVPGVPRYHRAECILIRFMGEDDLDRTTLKAASESGCTPCRACQPELADPA